MIRFAEARGEQRATFNLNVAPNSMLVPKPLNFSAERATLPDA